MRSSWSSVAVLALASLSEAAPTLNKTSTPVSSSALRAKVAEEALVAKGQVFQDIAYATEGRNRVIGSPGHEATVQYLVDTLTALDYYDVSLQPFTVETSSADLSINNVTFESSPLTYTPAGTPVAPLVPVSNLGCEATDFPAAVAGKIALISRGNCTFAIKVTNAKTAGAIGAVVYQSATADGVVSGTLGGPGDYVPVVGITYADGQSLIALINSNSTQTAFINSVVTELTTNNVIAETKGGDKNNVLVVGAHSDSVAEGPGINDNGSGSVGILEVAIQLASFSVTNAVRFAWWSAEEIGLIGAENYVANLTDAEAQKIRLYLNFDMIASPNYVYEIYDGDGSSFNISGPAGSAEAEKLFQDYLVNDAGVSFVPSAFDGRSDYGPFLEVDIAAGGLSTGADGIKTVEEAAIYGGTAGEIYDPNYHTDRDILANTNSSAWFELSKGIAHAVATYATSWEGFPAKAKRDVVAAKQKRTAAVQTAGKPTRKGGKWII